MTFKGGPINITTSLGWYDCITEYYLGAMLVYLEIRISDTFGWPEGMLYKLDLQY